MAEKVLSLTKLAFFIICIFTIGCSEPKDEKVINILEKVDVSQIPTSTIFKNDTMLKSQNGVYYFKNKTYSGFIKELYETNTLKNYGTYFKGKQHGTTKTYFPDGKIATERSYKNGLSYGRHVGYWENGKMKFDFIYIDDKREGKQKQWYESGIQYFELNFTDDQENGMQKVWSENGKLYINYEVKDGIRYGLQKSALCFTLKNEQLK